MAAPRPTLAARTTPSRRRCPAGRVRTPRPARDAHAHAPRPRRGPAEPRPRDPEAARERPRRRQAEEAAEEEGERPERAEQRLRVAAVDEEAAREARGVRDAPARAQGRPAHRDARRRRPGEEAAELHEAAQRGARHADVEPEQRAERRQRREGVQAREKNNGGRARAVDAGQRPRELRDDAVRDARDSRPARDARRRRGQLADLRRPGGDDPRRQRLLRAPDRRAPRGPGLGAEAPVDHRARERGAGRRPGLRGHGEDRAEPPAQGGHGRAERAARLPRAHRAAVAPPEARRVGAPGGHREALGRGLRPRDGRVVVLQHADAHVAVGRARRFGGRRAEWRRGRDAAARAPASGARRRRRPRREHPAVELEPLRGARARVRVRRTRRSRTR